MIHTIGASKGARVGPVSVALGVLTMSAAGAQAPTPGLPSQTAQSSQTAQLSQAAQSSEAAMTAPTIAIDRASVKPGERVLVTLAGWKAQVVTVAVCGNLAKRGSSDCNMAASQSVGITRGIGTALAQLNVPGPPTHCPCVLRASSSAQDEVALVPIELIGVPLGPLVDSATTSPLGVSFQTRRAEGGFTAAFRAALGGPTFYEVTVVLRNRTSETLPGVRLVGSVGRSRTDELVSFPLPISDELAPGATWTHTTRVRLPAPAFGSFVWSVDSVDGSSLERAETSMTLFPKGLVALVGLLIVDLLAMAWRMRPKARKARMARRVARSAAFGGDASSGDAPDGDASIEQATPIPAAISCAPPVSAIPPIDLTEVRPTDPASPRSHPVAPGQFAPPGSSR